ncbi:hypothetical protein FIU87_10565 [Bacillus sp. THAF10]|nr:hypothetical protein [Bacillus sp. THAF10]QFT89089.1 hypothetical protein FIU87_10565 [Bacillus sp. THAF10]
MLRYYKFVTRLGENIVEETEDQLERGARKAIRMIRYFKRRLDNLDD